MLVYLKEIDWFVLNESIQNIKRVTWRIRMSAQFDHVSVVKKSNVYFDGLCVSHTVQFEDGTKKTLGVLLPSK